MLPATPEPAEIGAELAWCVVFEGFDPQAERARESVLSLADTMIGTRGSLALHHPASDPLVLVAGIYEGEGASSRLASAPGWAGLTGDLAAGAAVWRTLDLKAGVLAQEIDTPELRLRVLQFSSLARPGTVALRVQADCSLPDQDPPLKGGDDPAVGCLAGPDPIWTAATPSIAAAASQSLENGPGRAQRLDRIAVYRTGAPERAIADLQVARSAGFDRLLSEHAAAWERRWQDADIEIEGDPDLQRALRLALFHLMASAAGQGEAAMGARGLSGEGYRGHVFWDTDVFILPMLAATHASAARAILEYRVRRLPAARAAALRAGCQGARFPWESAANGEDVTPRSYRDRAGNDVPILTGEMEEHIVADVAWAAALYIDWTADAEFANGPGRLLLGETARYWASRIRLREGRGHIDRVIGPDEYHEAVDDNAFTNIMARWNLHRAVTAGAARSEEEARAWTDLAGRLVDGYDPATRLYEQFAGFWKLEPLLIAAVAPRRPVAADLLLGRDRVVGAQVLKQADVLMAHHLVPEEMVGGSLGANLDFYEPRTAHGSSLSTGVHAAVLARAGRLEEALELTRLTAAIDLDDLTRTTAGGLHLAAMGSLWQAVVNGFAGIRAVDGGLTLDPRLPAAWRRLRIRLRHRGVALRFDLGHDEIEIESRGQVRIRIGEAGLAEIEGLCAWRRRGLSWEVQTT